jgi:hypothetical protein
MKTSGEVEVSLYAFLASALAGIEWSASRPGRFAAGERAPLTHWIEGWVGPRGGLDAVVKQMFHPLGKPPPVPEPVVSHFTNWAAAACNARIPSHAPFLAILCQQMQCDTYVLLTFNVFT